MNPVIIVLCVLFLNGVLPMYSTTEEEGYPSGYLSECPGSNKQAVISDKSKKQITFTVQAPGRGYHARRKTYNFYQVDELAKDPFLDWNKKTLFYVGGYLDSINFPMAWTVGKHYRELGYNTILLDMNVFVTIEYSVSCRFMRPIGALVAEVLVNLTRTGLDPKKLEMFGASLGAHTMGFIAKNYKKMTGNSVSRLNGLDPSGPCFRHAGPEDRLDETDADFVMALHTNIDGFGMAAPIGHVNFYINGGEFQPGDLLWAPCGVLCSHARCFTIWMSALENPGKFIAVKCNSIQQARDKKCYDNVPMETTLMQHELDPSKKGIYYVATSSEFPYYLGKKGMKRENEFYDSKLRSFNEASVMTM